MNDNSPFLELFQPCDKAVEWLSGRLSGAGLQVIRTFDLQAARPAQAQCPCPHHGTSACDCQMMVLLVYQGKQEPITVVAHGHDRWTWFAFVDTAEQPADPQLAAIIHNQVASATSTSAYIENPAYPN